MKFVSLQKQYFNSGQKITAAVFTSLIVLILLTPLCGFLFNCGCTWPWSGLDSKCNFYQHNTVHKCPWCASLITGWVSVGVSFASGVFVTVSPLPLLGDSVRNESLIRILLGTMTFLCVAILAGWLAAGQQNYPLGIFG
jgi:ABC-type Fe3+ transport system permease subunit